MADIHLAKKKRTLTLLHGQENIQLNALCMFNRAQQQFLNVVIVRIFLRSCSGPMANVQLLISVWTIGPVFWWKIYLPKCSYGSWNRNWYTLRLLWVHTTRVYQYMPTIDGSLRLECQLHFCSSYKVTFLISTETSMAGPKCSQVRMTDNPSGRPSDHAVLLWPWGSHWGT